MNRLVVGLAVGAGYLLGRTKKAKLAFAVGTMVAGRRLQLSPGALARAVTQQLENNPQFKEIGDQLKEDLRGVGKAATGSLLDRQLEGLADRLHDRTLDVRDRLSGAVPDADEATDKAKDTGDTAADAGKSAAEKTGSGAKKTTSAARGAGKSAKKSTASRGTRQRSTQQRGTQQRSTAERGAQKRSPAKKTARARGGGDD
ncbi:DNA primase [Streptomyces lasiicapitis]|uniref:DNA primase n=1 Tax=Streptomyces lasiicapitis TaxID=1923961 RepID=UPI0036987477